MVRAMSCHACVGFLLVASCALGGCGRPLDLPDGFTGTEQLEGEVGGTTEAYGWAHGCSGFVSAEPDHQVMNEGRLPYARIVANGGSLDTSLIVQLSDGTFRCSDDDEGHHPIVEGSFPAGLMKIWVGVSQPSFVGPYHLVISTDRATTASSLGDPAER